MPVVRSLGIACRSAFLSLLLLATGCGRVWFQSVSGSSDGGRDASRDAGALDSMIAIDSSIDAISDAGISTPGCMLFCPDELSTLSTSGAAWDALYADATGPLGTADLSMLDNSHPTNVLALALVAVRTNDDVMRQTVVTEVMSALGTENGGNVLTVARGLPPYIFAADLVGLASLSPSDDATFRAWLAEIRTRDIIGHPRWTNITFSNGDSGNDWGSRSGLVRIAASLYLADASDVAAAAQIFYGFVGDRGACSGFEHGQNYDSSWSCQEATWTPINPACVLSGINADGAAVESISSQHPLGLPIPSTNMALMEETLRPLYLQAWLLKRVGYPDPFGASQEALRRAVAFLFFHGWDQPGDVNHVLPWMVNAIYGTTYPTQPAGAARTFGYSDWLAPIFSR